MLLKQTVLQQVAAATLDAPPHTHPRLRRHENGRPHWAGAEGTISVHRPLREAGAPATDPIITLTATNTV